MFKVGRWLCIPRADRCTVNRGENVYNRLHFNVYIEKYTLDMVVAWKSRAEGGRQKILGG